MVLDFTCNNLKNDLDKIYIKAKKINLIFKTNTYKKL